MQRTAAVRMGGITNYFLAVQNRRGHFVAPNIHVLLVLRITEKFGVERPHEQSCADEYRNFAHFPNREED